MPTGIPRALIKANKDLKALTKQYEEVVRESNYHRKLFEVTSSGLYSLKAANEKQKAIINTLLDTIHLLTDPPSRADLIFKGVPMRADTIPQDGEKIG